MASFYQHLSGSVADYKQRSQNKVKEFNDDCKKYHEEVTNDYKNILNTYFEKELVK